MLDRKPRPPLPPPPPIIPPRPPSGLGPACVPQPDDGLAPSAPGFGLATAPGERGSSEGALVGTGGAAAACFSCLISCVFWACSESSLASISALPAVRFPLRVLSASSRRARSAARAAAVAPSHSFTDFL